MAARPNRPVLATLSFELNKQPHQDSYARTGLFKLCRDNGESLTVATPGLMAPSSRGVVPHLSQDQLSRIPDLNWIHVPFEN